MLNNKTQKKQKKTNTMWNNLCFQDSRALFNKLRENFALARSISSADVVCKVSQKVSKTEEENNKLQQQIVVCHITFGLFLEIKESKIIADKKQEWETQTKTPQHRDGRKKTQTRQTPVINRLCILLITFW